MSFDTVAENRAFARKFDFPFRLLSDSEHTIAMAYGACASPDAAYPQRFTFVIGTDGVIEHSIDTKDPAGQAGAILGLL